MSARATMRGAIALIIIAGFFVVYFLDPDDATMKGALIAAFAGAWGYYLGSSQGAHENREILNRELAARREVGQ